MVELDLKSCRPVAHSNEAATFNRANMFAMWKAFGPSTVFIQ